MTIDNTYKEHHVFTQLSEYADFYKSLAFSIFGFITQGQKLFVTLTLMYILLYKGHLNQ